MASIQPTHLAQVAIPVHDLERAKRFYGERLGLAHLFDAPPGLAFFQCGQTRLMLSQPEGPETAGSSILYYAVGDSKEAQARLAADGVVFEEEARCIARVGGRDVWLAVCRDSEGNLIGLMSEQATAG
ncbi:MAG TPA: VOC family protein [Allosphingosinicella sp.]|nr:VOC family protein [Allosphingosinicella sp.]